MLDRLMVICKNCSETNLTAVVVSVWLPEGPPVLVAEAVLIIVCIKSSSHDRPQLLLLLLMMMMMIGV